MRSILLFGSMALALLIGVISLQVPAPRGLDTPAVDFAAARAMADVRVIARAPHPIGSVEHERVRGYLFGRMIGLGLNPALQTGSLSPATIRWLATQSDTPPTTATNIVGVLPGTDPSAPAIVIMAHYDTTPESPGAADDGAGVAAILEAVRAIKARGAAERTLIVLLTDAEEVGLDGARVFFSEHPWRSRIGAVVNLEARGGGGRAMMFETGPGNRQTIALFSHAARRADGGTTSNSLTALVYQLMPNGTDFTLARDRGIAGLNLAFQGRPAQYHSPASTPDALDQGSVQHIGSQALEATDLLLRTPALPRATQDQVFSDILGLGVIGHAPQTGWTLFALALGLAAFAFWGGRHAMGLSFADVGRGMVSGLWFLATVVVLTQATRVLAGPVLSPAVPFDLYYTLMRRLPWMEASAALTVLAVALTALAGRDAMGQRVLTGALVLAAGVATLLGGVNLVVIAAAIVAIALSWWTQAWPRTRWGGWLGLIALVLLLGGLVQAVAPAAAFILLWPALIAAAAAALAALIGARLAGVRSHLAPAAALVLGGAWLVNLAHPAFLGIGMDLPAVLGVVGLLLLMLARPLTPTHPRALAAAAVACLILACGLSATARFAEPAPTPAEADAAQG